MCSKVWYLENALDLLYLSYLLECFQLQINLFMGLHDVSGLKELHFYHTLLGKYYQNFDAKFLADFFFCVKFVLKFSVLVITL